jgi:hypothetical protein
MKRSRRNFIQTLAASGGLLHIQSLGATARATPLAPIDRAALVHRHSPVLRQFEQLSPLSVGNGEFAFTADVTGLQTFPEVYEQEAPLCTMSQWGWHSAPAPAGLDPKALRLVQFDTFGRQVGYAVSADGQNELYNWLRENPHRLHLGRVALRLTKSGGGEAQVADITDIEQRLDLWTGVLTSRFKFEGKPVTVKTAAHPALDLLAVSIESPLIAEGRLAARFAFPYGSPSMQAADWKQTENHRTEVTKRAVSRVELRRQLDADQYFAGINWNGRAEFTVEKPHHFILAPAKQNPRLEFTAVFSPSPLTGPTPSSAATFSASASHWNRFWTAGGAVELAESRDPRAPELERRIVLSQYLTAIQCAGSMPPQETGLTVNSWYGKFHLEMHWWHAAHFALWNRTPMLERSLGWYDRILPAARDLARSQGYAGARWPKMVGPQGADSPSPIGPLLIWQQPHPITYAELSYLTRPNRRTLERYQSIVFESAEFMASFAHFDKGAQRYALGPPVIPAQENHPPRETWNPTYELAYWSYGLKTAQRWRERLGMKRNPKWDDVISKLAPLPASNGVYLAHENCPQTYTERNHDHPSMLAALGVLPGDGVDREIMRRTLHKTMKEWKWDQTWGWDYPMTAMTAARLGETEIAVAALLLKSEKNRYLPNGHNWQRKNLPCYLPGNGGLLYAVAMMAAGWRGAPASHAPGFPSDGSWTIRWEKLNEELIREI